MVLDLEDEYVEEEYYLEDMIVIFDDGYYDEGGVAVDNIGEGDQAIVEEDVFNYEDVDSDLQIFFSWGFVKDGCIKLDFSFVVSG